MERSALALPESVAQTTFQGLVRITTIGSLASYVLVSSLAGFARKHPGIVLEVLTDIRVMSLARREADIALRLGRPKDSSLIGRHLASVHYAFYAAQGGPSDGAHARFITYDIDAVGIAEAAWLAKGLRSRAVSFRSNSIEAQAAAARSGIGIVLLPRYMGDVDNALAEVHALEPYPPRELWLLSPRELARMPHVRLVMDTIAEIIDQNMELIEGKGSLMTRE
jgi:DNA-binding transcriptional LysR family regulator